MHFELKCIKFGYNKLTHGLVTGLVLLLFYNRLVSNSLVYVLVYWDNLIYITKDMIRDIYHIVGLCSDDYSYIITI